MRSATVLSATLVVTLTLPLATTADVYTVVPEGGGDFTDIPTGMRTIGTDDTLLVAPGTYVVDPTLPPPGDWPILFQYEGCPALMSMTGAEATIIQGDGTTPAFTTPPTRGYPIDVRIVGFTISDTSEPVECGGLVTFLFTDNIVEENGYGLNAYDSVGLIARNVFRNNGGPGIWIYHCQAIIEQNEICYNEIGIEGFCCEEPLIRNNHVHHNSGHGIRTGFSCQADSNLVEHNAEYGFALGGSAELTRNVIRWNGDGVRLPTYGTTVSIHLNDIYGNTGQNLVAGADPGGPTPALDATDNWWGTTDPDEIAAGIWDCNDDPDVMWCVLFDPWCDVPGCEAIAVEPASWGAIKALYR